MRYKLLIGAAIIFTIGGISVGALFNKDPNTSMMVIILTCIDMFLLAMTLVAFKMLRKQNAEGKEYGYKEGVTDVLETAEEMYGVDEANILAENTKNRLNRSKVVKGDGHVHTHMHDFSK